MRPSARRQIIHGVDFSGAVDAGRKIWIATGRPAGKGIGLLACRPAEALPGGGRDLPSAVAALRALIVSDPAAACGMDFPFSLPRRLLVADSWTAFAADFGARHPDPQAFRRECLAITQGRELRRGMDAARRAPFASYNWRLYRQTYFGIRDVLAPLVREQRAAVIPMQPPRADLPWLLEICPAVTLKAQGLYRPYKGRTPEHRAMRQYVLAAYEQREHLVVAPDLAAIILADAGGDALDSVIAACTTWRAVHDPARLTPADGSDYQVEGCIYV